MTAVRMRMQAHGIVGRPGFGLPSVTGLLLRCVLRVEGPRPPPLPSSSRHQHQGRLLPRLVLVTG
jgi:hypothetical protein